MADKKERGATMVQRALLGRMIASVTHRQREVVLGLDNGDALTIGIRESQSGGFYGEIHAALDFRYAEAVKAELPTREQIEAFLEELDG